VIALVLAMAAGQEVQGFAELRATAAIGADGPLLQVIERFRPTFEAPLGDRFFLSTTVEMGFVQGRNNTDIFESTLRNSDLGPLLDAANCEWPDNANNVFRIDRASDYLAVDRLYVDAYHPKFDLRIGRQALQWGSALFINPTDPFPQVLFTEPFKPRAGVNSARLTVPFGDLNQVQAVIGTNDSFTKVRAAVRGTVNAVNTDFSVVSAYRQESDEVLVGLDIKGTLGVGFWLEGGVAFRGLTDESLDVYETVAVGADYSFPVLQSLIVTGQYIRNGAEPSGASVLSAIQPPECDVATPFNGAAAEPDPFAPFLSGRDYGLLAVSSAVTRDLMANVVWLQNMGDGSAILVPSASIQLPKGFDVSVTAQVPVSAWGDGGEFHPSDDDLMLSVPIGDTNVPIDLSGLVPDASVFVWTRYNF
jgi:hypothetical protein